MFQSFDSRTKWYGQSGINRMVGLRTTRYGKNYQSINQSHSYWQDDFLINPASTLTLLKFLGVFINYLWLLVTNINWIKLIIEIYAKIVTILSMPFCPIPYCPLPFCPVSVSVSDCPDSLLLGFIIGALHWTIQPLVYQSNSEPEVWVRECIFSRAIIIDNTGILNNNNLTCLHFKIYMFIIRAD